MPNHKIIFIAPLKALAKERIIDWKKRLEYGIQTVHETHKQTKPDKQNQTNTQINRDSTNKQRQYKYMRQYK
jgi:replicative superfamily II helicase